MARKKKSSQAKSDVKQNAKKIDTKAKDKNANSKSNGNNLDVKAKKQKPDEELENLKYIMWRCKLDLEIEFDKINDLKKEKDRCRNEINSINDKISRVKRDLSYECSQHKWNIESGHYTEADYYKEHIIECKSKLNVLYDELREKYSKLESIKRDLDKHYHEVEIHKELKHRFKMEYQERLDELNKK